VKSEPAVTKLMTLLPVQVPAGFGSIDHCLYFV
jgi:hypothetical protein